MTEEHPFSSLKNSNENLVIVDKTYYENNFCFVPYVPNGRFKEAIETNPEKLKNIIFLKILRTEIIQKIKNIEKILKNGLNQYGIKKIKI